MASFRGFEFFYRLSNGTWSQTESSSIVSPEHILEAFSSYENAGFRSIAKRGFGFCASGPSQESRDADYARSESNMRLLVAGSAYAV
jgi:hypothetical protein